MLVALPFASAMGWPGPRPFHARSGGVDEGEQRRDTAAVDAAMERYAAGDDAAFPDLYDLLAPRLFGYLMRQTRDRARAEDLLQQTLLQMHAARGRFIPGSQVLPWAFAIARRLMIDGMRRGKREVLRAGNEGEGEGAEPAAADDAADDLVEARELAGRLQKELARLPENQRVAFELIKQEGLSVAQAAEVLGTTVTAVKLRAHRAYEALRGILGDA
jgi:RNA polymerase sigma-70 factor, ECF subfamily